MHDFPETDPSLIIRVKDLGDGASWVEFANIYQPVIFRMATRRGLQDADAHDLVQQVFVGIAGAIDRWEADNSRPPFRAWLTTITRNAISKSLGRRPRDQATGSTSALHRLNAIPLEDRGVVDEVRSETRRSVFALASRKVRVDFSPVTWELFWRTAVLGESVSAVATETGRSPGAVYLARHRVMARFKAVVAEISIDWELEDLGL